MATNCKRFPYIKNRLCIIPTQTGTNAFCDISDFEKVKERKWTLVFRGKSLYATNKGKYLHRVIMNPDKRTIQIDHKNHNGLDNRRNNLRLCSGTQNCHNHGLKKCNKSGIKGVYWDKERKKWHAQIRINWKLKFLGRYDSLEDAARVYNAESLKHYGQFSVPNIV